jgi:mono/diheme cytochrome c family protein
MTRVMMTVLAVLISVAGLGAQDAKKVAAGKDLYQKYACEKCHQIAGKGSKISPLDGVASKMTAAEMKQWITDPDSMTAKLAKKPAAKMKKIEMPEPEVDAIVAYLQTLKK